MEKNLLFDLRLRLADRSGGSSVEMMSLTFPKVGSIFGQTPSLYVLSSSGFAFLGVCVFTFWRQGSFFFATL